MSTVGFDEYYAALSDRNDRIEKSRPHVYGGNTAVTSLRCFMRYDRNATLDIIDLYGVKRWLTVKQARIHAILMRDAGKEGLKMRLIAAESLSCPSTVSRTLTKFQAWGLFKIDVIRGRNGGISVRHAFGDRFSEYAARARAAIHKAKERVSLRINVASTILRLTKSGLLLRTYYSLDTVNYFRSPARDAAIKALEKEYLELKERTHRLLVEEDATFRAVYADLNLGDEQKEFVGRVLGEFVDKQEEEERRLGLK